MKITVAVSTLSQRGYFTSKNIHLNSSQLSTALQRETAFFYKKPRKSLKNRAAPKEVQPKFTEDGESNNSGVEICTVCRYTNRFKEEQEVLSYVRGLCICLQFDFSQRLRKKQALHLRE
jgi:hypothetical protein